MRGAEHNTSMDLSSSVRPGKMQIICNGTDLISLSATNASMEEKILVQLLKLMN